jgi:hypothetical protein
VTGLATVTAWRNDPGALFPRGRLLQSGLFPVALPGPSPSPPRLPAPSNRTSLEDPAGIRCRNTREALDLNRVQSRGAEAGRVQRQLDELDTRDGRAVPDDR